MKLKEGAELVSMSILPAEVMALASSDGEARGAGAGDDAEDAPTESDSSEDEEALGPCALIVSKQASPRVQGHHGYPLFSWRGGIAEECKSKVCSSA